MIQIHPKRAFLNSDVVISNKGQEVAFVVDSITHKSFILSPGEYKSSRYSAGTHNVSIKLRSGKIERQSFVVEDALKFGGSQRKGAYVFDNNPWAIIVMKDRTYFLNEETEEQFVEHNLSPDIIVEISRDYLLFTTGNDCSLFSLSTMSFEETLSYCECVYYGYGHCVLSSSDGLYLYRLNPQITGQRLDFIKCDKFVINEEEGIIYTYNCKECNKFHIIKFIDESTNDEYEQISTMEIDGDFVCFTGCQSLLYTKSNLENGTPNMLYCRNLSLMSSSSLIYSGKQPISSINGIKTSKSNSYDELYEKFRNNKGITGKGIRLSFEVIENTQKNYYIQTLEMVTFNKKTAETKITCNVYDQGGLIHHNDSKKLTFIHKGKYDYISCGESTIIFYDNSYKIVEGKVMFSKFDDPYIEMQQNGKNIYSSIFGTQIRCIEDKSNPSYGLFYLIDNGYTVFYWLKTGKEYAGDKIEPCGDNVIISGSRYNIPPRFFMANGDIIPVPKSSENMIAHSTTGKTILYENGGYINFYRYQNEKWVYSDNIVLSIYDTLQVKDAVFCTDGDSFIYQKENEMVLFDFETGNETVFETNLGIKYNANGYRPYCTKDYFSRPVIVDPLSHRIIDHNFLGQYRFSNIEGNVYYQGRITQRVLIEDNSVVSEDQYQMLRSEYDYSISCDRDKILRKRIQYCEEKLGHEVGMFSAEFTISDFVDHFIVKDIEYVVIYRYGCQVKIKIGTPLYFLNYVAFSADSNQVAICGKYRDASGLCLIYDFIQGKVVHRSTSPDSVGKTKAIWLGLFSKNGDIAYYDSTPDTYYLHEGKKITRIAGYSFLTFSPSGKLIALSRQGYTPYSAEKPFWGHNPSCDIYIARTDDPKNCLCHFNDHGSEIVGISTYRETVASASFSADDKKILSVSRDGVVVVRNLHLEDDQE